MKEDLPEGPTSKTEEARSFFKIGIVMLVVVFIVIFVSIYY